MTTTRDAIQAIGLSKAFDGHHVLRCVNLKVATGQSIAIMGANGAGKTTLLRCLAGVTRQDAGELWWHGEIAKRDSMARRYIGLVTHESQLYPNLTLHENLLFAARMHGLPCPGKQSREWLDRIGLLSFADGLPCHLSHGMRRRVSIARGLIHRPRTILLDEPFSGLDVEGRAWLEKLLVGLRRQMRSICFTTHDEHLAKSSAVQVFSLQGGELRENSAIQDPIVRRKPRHRQVA